MNPSAAVFGIGTPACESAGFQCIWGLAQGLHCSEQGRQLKLTIAPTALRCLRLQLPPAPPLITPQVQAQALITALNAPDQLANIGEAHPDSQVP